MAAGLDEQRDLEWAAEVATWSSAAVGQGSKLDKRLVLQRLRLSDHQLPHFPYSSRQNMPICRRLLT